MRTKRVFTVIDSHTAGHPTRTVTSGIPALRGDTVLAQRNDFRDNHDDLRSLLLHEPRGHAAMMAAVPVPSRVADQGLFFVSSYVYLDMCGHATIGYIASLAATGVLPASFETQGMSIETPAGVIHVNGVYESGELTAVVLRNVPSYVTFSDVDVTTTAHGEVRCDLAYSGITYALVDAEGFELPFDVQHANKWCAIAMDIKAAVNAASKEHDVGSVLFYKSIPGGSRHLVILAGNKFDRSPCGTGTSARLAQLHSRKQIDVGAPYRAENILGVAFQGTVLEATTTAEGKAAVVPEIRGMAHISAISTLILESSDPLPNGFLPG